MSILVFHSATARATLMTRLHRWWWRRRRLHNFISALRLCWRYMRGTLSQDDARLMMRTLYAPAGWEPLLVLDHKSTLDYARTQYRDCPELARYVAYGI